MPNFYVALDLVAALLTLWTLRKIFNHRNGTRHFPPGPKGYPVIGNLLDIPIGQEWLTYARWADHWGDIISFSAFGKHTVVLSSLQVAVDLLDKRSAIYSDRPHLTVAGDIIGHSKHIPLTPYGDSMKKQRRLFTRMFATSPLVAKFRPLIYENVQDLLLRLVESPQNFKGHIFHMTIAYILVVSHGHIVHDMDDKFVILSEKLIEEFAYLTTPGAFLADVIPTLRYLPSWLPGMGWKRTAEQWERDTSDAVEGPFEAVKREVAAGTAIPSFTSRALEDNDGSPDHEECVKHAATTLYTAGSDTTSSSIQSFFLAMTLYPEVQRRAQAEIDSVIGKNRLPEFQDRDDLPYINALCSEVVRWLTVSPLGFAHCLTEDDTYNGYFIPKGTVVWVNQWALLHDPKTYHDPMQFKPERFLGENPELNPNKIAFGFGRRACPGMLLVEATIFITVATILATLDISPVVENGEAQLPDSEVKQTSGIISRPLPFKCDVKPRSPSAESLIRTAVELR